MLQLASMLEASGTAFAVTDSAGTVTRVGSGFERLFGYRPGDVTGRTVTEMLAAPDTDPEAFVPSEDARQTEDLVHCACGQRLWVSTTIEPQFDGKGSLSSAFMVFNDITGTKLHEVLDRPVLAAMVADRPIGEIMELVCREAERIAPHVVATVLEVDDNGCLRTLAAPSMPPSVTAAIDGQPIGPVAGSCGTAAYRGEAVVVTSIEHDPLWADWKQLALPLGLRACWSSPIVLGDGEVVGTFAFYYRDERGPDPFDEKLVEFARHLCALALERARASRRLEELATRDRLTGLPNRGMVLTDADRLLVEAMTADEPLSLLSIDLDHFKWVNDEVGQGRGDAVLRLAAERMLASVRPGDVLGRVGDDEFVAVLPHCQSGQAATIADRVISALAEKFPVSGTMVSCGASVGISEFPLDGGEVDTLVRRARQAMHAAKTAGRGRRKIFHSEVGTAVSERVTLERALRRAIANDLLTVHFQPQLTSDGRRLHGAEALVRWRDPELGDIGPNRFIPVAEESGMIRDVLELCVDGACENLAGWRARGFDVPRVSVNVSAANLRRGQTINCVSAALQRYDLAPCDLTLEVTEGMVVDRETEMTTCLAGLRDMGVRLSLDDFGTGYSGFSYLHKLEFDELKIDRSFVDDIESSSTAQVLIASILDLAKSLDLPVVAEGVETAPQWAYLQARGCPALQGYRIARPMPPAETTVWLTAFQTSRWRAGAGAG